MKLGGQMTGLHRNDVNADVLEANRVSQRLVETHCIVVEKVRLLLPRHLSDGFC